MMWDDLSIPQKRAMAVLRSGPAETSNETLTAPRTVVGTVAERLLRHGLVRVTESHPSWRVVELTEKGRRLVETGDSA
jgi:hypothetical protein